MTKKIKITETELTRLIEKVIGEQNTKHVDKISKTTIYDMVKDGRLPSVSLPGVRRVFVRRSDLEGLINEK